MSFGPPQNREKQNVKFIADERLCRALSSVFEQIDEMRRLAARYDQTCPERGGDSRPDR